MELIINLLKLTYFLSLITIVFWIAMLLGDIKRALIEKDGE